ncbi:MAG: sodium:proton antiporter, partial [Verrucomicrobia bacterium]|nr:sodium:proton antiporter [Verrucomicrobiota bacterium]
MALPFGALLVTMAAAPLVCAGWWERNYGKFAGALGTITLGYYLLGLHAYGPVLHTAGEYLSFIVLIGSLFIVAGGIHLRVPGVATPLANTAFLLVGALVANLLGTTGAAVLLIRPWLRMNRHRVAAHHVVFFIFVVANVGGCLTPVGDPPLFLGYLKGIPFWWVARECGSVWLVGTLILLAEFYVLDYRSWAHATRPAAPIEAGGPEGRWQLDGACNLAFLGLILIAVFIQHPPLLREALMAGAALGSSYATRPSVRAANQFSLRPLIEVAVLFAGVFATMLPALQWLEWRAAHASGLTPSFFYWATGVLSSVLDNAPTYLGSLSAV